MTNEQLDELDLLRREATEGPYFVGDDNAHDTIAHKDSGLALIDTGRTSDWPVARLCEWPTAEYIAALCNAAQDLITAARSEARLRTFVEGLLDQSKDWWLHHSEARGEMQALGIPDDADAGIQVTVGELRQALNESSGKQSEQPRVQAPVNPASAPAAGLVSVPEKST